MAIDPVGGGMRPVIRPQQEFDPALARKFRQHVDAAESSSPSAGEAMRVVQAAPLLAPAVTPPPAISNGKPAAHGNFQYDPAYRWGAHLERNFIGNLGGPDAAPPESALREQPEALPPAQPTDWSTAFSDRELAGHNRSSPGWPDTNIEGFPGTPLPPPPPLVTPAQEPVKPEPIGGGYRPGKLEGMDQEVLVPPRVDGRLPPPKVAVGQTVVHSKSKPDGIPSGTLPIDKAKKKFGLDKDGVHAIKDDIGAGPEDWVGIDPKGDVWKGDENNIGENHGPYKNFLP